MTNTTDNIIGFDAQAYSQRVKGYSPEPIRDALWKLVSQELEGDVLDAGSGEGGWIKRLKGSKNIRRIISVDIIDDGASQIDGVEFHLTDISQSSLFTPNLTNKLSCYATARPCSQPSQRTRVESLGGEVNSPHPADWIDPLNIFYEAMRITSILAESYSQ